MTPSPLLRQHSTNQKTRSLLDIYSHPASKKVDSYLQKLRSLAKDCNFHLVSAEQHKDEAIRDAFIGGLQSLLIRQRLLEHEKLNLQKAYETARSLETAEKQSRSFQSGETCVSMVNKTEDTYQTEDEEISLLATKHFPACYFCGQKKHPRSKCPARYVFCRTCGKKEHFQRVCRGAKTMHKPVSSAMHSVISVITAAAGPKSLKQAMIRVEINGKHFSALIDSASSESFVNAAIAKQLKWPIFSSTDTISMASTNFTTKTQGHCSVKLK